jgi:hypothetical protein
MLGHSDLPTTIGYLHTTADTIRVLGREISQAMGETATTTQSTTAPEMASSGAPAAAGLLAIPV